MTNKLSLIRQRLELLWQEVEKIERENPEPGPGGTSDYTELTNKPSINGVELNGNKTLTQLGIASAASLSSLISQFDDLFAVDNVSVVSDGEYPTTIDSRLALHQPINLNNVNYYFFEENGVDYSYFAIDTSGAYPKISLAQLLKDSHRVVFYEFATDTVPTDNSDNFITSGGVYTALSGKEDKITTISANGTMTNSATIADTGVSVDIPADGGYWQVSGCITWKGSPPTEAQLRVKFGTRTSDYLIARATSANDDSKNFIYLPVSCTFKADAYYPSDPDKTIHVNVWGKTAAASGNCEVSLIARKIGTATNNRGLKNSRDNSKDWDKEADEWNWLKDER